MNNHPEPIGSFNAGVVALEADSSIDFLEAAFDYYEKRQVFAIVRSDASLDALGQTVQRHTFAQPTRKGWMRLGHTPQLDDAPAQIVFTSGTEGKPKAIVLSHRNLARVVTELNRFMGVTSDIREYIGVPVTYSFGLGRARAVAAAGGEAFLPDHFDPAEIRDMLAAGTINAISAVPSLWRVLLSASDIIGATGQAVRWIEIGSQYMSAADKQAMRELFPNARIVQHYGLSEASRSCFLDISAGHALESVGKPMQGADLRIQPDGAIAIHGEHVALGRLDDDGGLVSLTDTDGWLVTKDRGALRDGWVYFLGRLDDQINVSGIKVDAERMERQISEIVTGLTDRFAITAIPDDLRGESVLVVVQSDLTHMIPLVTAAARLVLEQYGISPSGVLTVTDVDQLPRTDTGKIRRAALRDTHAARPDAIPPEQGDTRTARDDLTEDERDIVAMWRRVLGPLDIGPSSSFYDAGGDSLSSVQIGLVMEGAGCTRASVRATFEGRPLSAVAKLAKPEDAQMTELSRGKAQADDAQALPDLTARSWAISLTRGVMVLSVVISHWAPGLMARMGLEAWGERYLSLVYRMGTPGFAMVFGLGVGYFMLPGFAAKRASVLKRVEGSFRLVASGFLLLSAIRLSLALLEGEPLNGRVISGSFFNVLAYYTLALGTAPFWIPRLAAARRPIVGLLFAVPILWIIWQVAIVVLAPLQQDSLLEWPRLMAIANYSVFKMGLMTALGIATGYWFAHQNDTDRAAGVLATAGGVGCLVCLSILTQAYGLEGFSGRRGAVFDAFPSLLLYAAFGLLLVGVFVWATQRWQAQPMPVRVILQLLIVTGGLALPIYVFHSMVIPSADVLQIAGASKGVALVVSLGLFLAGMIYAGRRLYRMYF